MPDIYSINAWATATIYDANSIVLVGNTYYYATTRHTSAAAFATDLAAGRWNGVLTNDGQQRPYFFWRASYDYALNIKPAVRKIQYGDGYTSDYSDGINNILLPFEASFKDRDLNEYTAIVHFLSTRAGVERFFFIPPSPFNVIKLFVCQDFTATQTFYDKYTVTAKFEERF